MRLLHRDSDGKISLTNDVVQYIPAYAILSHTWGTDNEEVTFEDIQNNPKHAKSKAGYRKIDFCAKQAASDALEYFWVDTCCIDKSSSTEFSGAINSMFRWYRNAAKCYVYLADVSTFEQTVVSESSTTVREIAFRQSRWFTRGWTLQELIAPTSVEFFSREGDRLGSKKTLEVEIHEITGVPIQALRGAPLTNFGVKERMSWAMDRKTTIAEDEVYCLLGIFNVFMPLMYGEGRKFALERLRKEIHRFPKHGRSTLDAFKRPLIQDLMQSWSKNSKPPLAQPLPSFDVPFHRDVGFIDCRTPHDRGTLLEQIEWQCIAPAAKVALVGINGAGKSQLAVEYCYRLHDRSPDTWVFWIHASNITRIEQGYREIAERVNIAGRTDPRQDLFKLVVSWLRDETKGKWVLVLDNLDDDDVVHRTPEFAVSKTQSTDGTGQILPFLTSYLPRSQNGTIIITTRTRSVATRLVGSQNIISLGPMIERDATTLLNSKLEKRFRYADLQELVGLLGYVPLAIVDAAAYIQQRGATYSVRQYIEELQHQQHKKENDNDDIVSLRSVDTLDSTVTGSSKTMLGEVIAGANEFVDLLLGDHSIATLLNTGFNRIKADKLERNIKRLLKLYAVDLRQEAGGVIEKEAVQLIMLRASYIAYRVRQYYDVTTSEEASRWDQLISQTPDKRALLEKYVQNRARPEYDADHDGEDLSDSSAPSEVEPDQPELNDLDRVKIFMVESAAYQIFRQNLEDFVLPRREPERHDPISSNPDSSFLDTWRRIRMKGVEVFYGLQVLSRPLVPPGHTRITWICGCGDHRYADVREYRSNGASALEALLRKSVPAGHADGASNTASTSLQSPPHARLKRSAVRDGFHNRPSSDNASTNRVASNNVAELSTDGSPSAQTDHMFLLLCATVGGSSSLEQLSIRDLNNDQYLWDKIRERYYGLRGKTLWHQKLAVTRWLSSTKRFSWLVKGIDLTIVKSIEFVQFQLVPIAMDIRPWNFHSPSFPPEAEVRVKKAYHYFPCPVAVDPTGLNGELFHCLWKPGPHLDRFWLDFFPKKLSETLRYTSSRPEMNVGWGIHVVEGIDWVSVTYLAFVLGCISGVLGIVYSTVTHDVGGGFGMATFLTTIPALGIAMLQLRPIDV